MVPPGSNTKDELPLTLQSRPTSVLVFPLPTINTLVRSSTSTWEPSIRGVLATSSCLSISRPLKAKLSKQISNRVAFFRAQPRTPVASVHQVFPLHGSAAQRSSATKMLCVLQKLEPSSLNSVPAALKIWELWNQFVRTPELGHWFYWRTICKIDLFNYARRKQKKKKHKDPAELGGLPTSVLKEPNTFTQFPDDLLLCPSLLFILFPNRIHTSLL